MRSGVSKPIPFFLAACKDSGIQVSPYFKKLQLRPGAPRPGRKLREEVGDDNGKPEVIMPTDPSPRSSGSSRTISLRGGGSATLKFDVDVWSMPPEDQEFVFGLIRKMTEYEQTQPKEKSTTS